MKVVKPTLQIAVSAGELRKRARISMLDCYVIATANAMRATPLFLKMEREMEPYADLLSRYGVKFLADHEPHGWHLLEGL